MAENKKSFILYADLIHTVKKMPKDKAGELLMTILSYVNDEEPIVEDILIDLVFEPIKRQMKRDLSKYEDKKKKFSDAGKASAEARRIAKENEQKITKINDVEKRSTFSTVNDTVNDTVTVNVNGNVINKEREKKNFSPPSLLEVQDFIIEKKYGVNAHSFWNFYESKNWMVGKNKMKDWKKSIAGWDSRDKPNKPQNGNTTTTGQNRNR